MPRFNTRAPWLKRLLGRGANTDIRPELLPDGYYRDALNMHPSSVDGDTGGLEAIGGEQLVYGDFSNSAYVCIGSASSGQTLFSVWASAEPDTYPLVIINGVIVATSPNIPYTYDRPLQIAVRDRNGRPVMYPADHQSPPLYWDCVAMTDALAAGSDEYFDGYTIETNLVTLSTYNEFPRHTGNFATPAGGGLSPGQYSYLLRYVTATGDKTNLGPETPLISVGIVHDSTWNTAIPGARTTGGEADPTFPTTWSIQTEFNVDNYLGFDAVEIVRRRFNEGQGLNGNGTLEVIATIPLAPGEFTYNVFNDPQDQNTLEVIAPDEEEQRQFDILAPKSVEFADNRLSYANFSTAPLVPDYDFTLVNGLSFVPITGKVTTTVDGVERNSGYTDPVNNTYKKSFKRGEAYGLGIQGWDSKNAKPFVVTLPNGGDEYIFPNRRDRKTGDSATYSDSDVFAVTTDCQSANPVDRTFEVFTQGTYAKNNNGVINVMQGDYASAGYNPWTPVNPGDTDVWGLRTKPISVVKATPVSIYPDAGAVFNQQYNALGVAIYGITPPSNIKAFSVVRTAPAGRVVAQGILTYDLIPGESGAPGRKFVTQARSFSRDLVSGLVPLNLEQDIQNNPQDYEFQFVSPLGFYSEQYGAYVTDPSLGLSTARRVDPISYAGILHDEGQVNAGEPAAGGMGYPGTGAAPPGNYVGWTGWRSGRPATGQGPADPTDVDYSFWNRTGNDGNTPLPITSFQLFSEGRGRGYLVGTGDFFYPPPSSTTNGIRDFQNNAVRQFHQPFYVVNIVRRGAEVPDSAGQFINTGTTIKVEACIGYSGGGPSTHRLINERLEDVMGMQPTDLRYVWIQVAGQPTRPWLCITGNGTVDFANALAQIADSGSYTDPDGVEVFGLYTITYADDRPFVTFGEWSGTSIPVPESGARILVRYDKRSPVKAFGGDCTITPQTHAIYDRRWLLQQPDLDALTINGLPLPYQGWVFGSNYAMPQSSDSESPRDVDLSMSIRQWCVMYDAESTTQPWMDLFLGATNRSLPRIHYQCKPYDLTPGIPFFPQYDIDYAGSAQWFNFGGFYFQFNDQTYNLDYWKQPNVQFVGEPVDDSNLRTEYWNGIIASLEADPNVDNGPGLRTFLPSNLKLISEENGEIKMIASMLGGAGQNIYALTESGLCRVLTNKNILTGASGEQVSTQSITNYWGTEQWITRVIGSPDQMWRLATKAYAPAGQSYADSIVFPNRTGVYRLVGDSIVNISEDKYFDELKDTLRYYPTGYSLNSTAFFNSKYNEVWISLLDQAVPPDPPIRPFPIFFPRRLFVYSAKNNEWVGKYSYGFDSFCMLEGQAYGFRNVETYLLDIGDEISSDIRPASVVVPFVGERGKLKEAFRWRVVGTKPDEMRLYDKDLNLLCVMNEALAEADAPGLGSEWALRYDSYEGYIWAINQQTEFQGLPPEDEYFYLECKWNTAGDKEAVSLELQARPIK